MKATLASPSLRLPIGLAFFGFVLIGINEGANGVLIPSLSTFYSVNNATIGLLFFLTSFGYFLAALGCGLLIQHIGLRWVLLLASIAFLLGVLPFGLKLPFLLLLPTRLLLGLSVGLLETGLNIYITDLPRSTLRLNYLHAFYGVGALIGPVAASIILTLQWGWNSVYFLLGGLSLVLLFGFTFFSHPIHPNTSIHEQQHSTPENALITTIHSEQHPTSENVLSAAMKLPIVWLTALFLLVYVGIEVSLGNWSYSFLLQDHHESPFLAGWIVSGYWLGLTLGRFLLQNLTERLGIGTKELLYACMLTIGLGLLLIWLIPNEILTVIAFFFIGFGLGPIYPLTVAIMPKLVPPHLGPSAIGVLVSVSIIGLAVFPWIAGILAQLLGIWTLLPYALSLTLILLAIWLTLIRHTNHSLDVRETTEQLVS